MPTTILIEIERLPKISLQLVPSIEIERLPEMSLQLALYAPFEVQLGEEVYYLYNPNNKLNI
jgi:hypothetical protein